MILRFSFNFDFFREIEFELSTSMTARLIQMQNLARKTTTRMAAQKPLASIYYKDYNLPKLLKILKNRLLIGSLDFPLGSFASGIR